jgi:hypothetical protein
MTGFFRARAILAVFSSHPFCRLGARAEVMDWSRRPRQTLTHGEASVGFWMQWSGQATGPSSCDADVKAD